MPATIFSGSKVKTLKSTLNLNGGADVISSTTDPTSVAVSAEPGSILLNTTTGKQYRKNDSGSSTNWSEIGSGAGTKNYIQKGTFDSASTSGWSLASSTLDATTKLPNQASGAWGAASANLSITTVGSGSQLSLSGYSLSLVSSAATVAGNMLVSDAITLDAEAQASIQTFSFFYKVASGAANGNFSGTSSNSIGVAIYDVTNSAWIDPAGRYNIVQNSLVGKCAGTFQVPATCTSVRLAVYFPNASSGAITVYLDDFVLGPQVVQYGAPVTDWQDYTPTLTNIGNATSSAQWRRIGDSIEIRGRVTIGSSLPTGSLTIGVPSGITLDTSSSSTTTGFCATGTAAGVAGTHLGRIVRGSTSVTLSGDDGSSFWTATVPVTWQANDTIDFLMSCKVVGWTSSVSMSNDTDTRVISAFAQRGSNQAITGATNTVNFDSVNWDNSSAITTGASWKFTAPISGYYTFNGLIESISTIWAAGNRITAFLYKNGSSELYVGAKRFDAAITTLATFPFQGMLYLKAGDYVHINLDTSVATSINSSSYIAISRLSGPSVIAASETVAAHYQSNKTTALTGTPTQIDFNSKEYDSHNAVTTGASWKFTAPISGKYLIKSKIETSSTAASAVTNRYSIRVYINGVLYEVLGVTTANITSATIKDLGGSTTVNLIAGDYIDVRISASNSGDGHSLSGTLSGNHLSIERVGN